MKLQIIHHFFIKMSHALLPATSAVLGEAMAIRRTSLLIFPKYHFTRSRVTRVDGEDRRQSWRFELSRLFMFQVGEISFKCQCMQTQCRKLKQPAPELTFKTN